jgi:CRISPR-associated endonuclease/helicase Cas3
MKYTEEINKRINKNNTYVITKTPYLGKRFNTQKKISKSIAIGGTSIVNAPGGFGKTVIPILFTVGRKEKMVIVTPRNVVADNIYRQILIELNGFGLSDVKVELNYSNEIKNSNWDIVESFTSDIVIVGIDYFLGPIYVNRNLHRLFLLNNVDVVFDEYHELIGDEALFACFINIMRTRHRMTNSTTILLSATPIDISFMWDNIDKKTVILPEKHKHYDAVHSKKYLIKVNSELSKINKGENNLIVFNNIKNAQLHKKILNCELLFHSHFMDDHRKQITDRLFSEYGKEQIRKYDRIDVVATHVIQASLDLSFANLYESVLSPEATLQRIGRIDRWGDYNKKSVINFINLNDDGEKAVVNILYNRNLSSLWFEELKKHDGLELTLNELYEVYNSFSLKNHHAIRKYINNSYEKSLEKLERLIYPIHFPSKKNKNVKASGSNKLRQSGLEVFVIAKMYNSSEYTDPITVRIYNDWESDFREGYIGDVRNQIIKVMKHLRESDFTDRFDYTEIINNSKKVTLDHIRSCAKKSITPYIRFDVKYHPEYGFIDNQILNIVITP